MGEPRHAVPAPSWHGAEICAERVACSPGKGPALCSPFRARAVIATSVQLRTDSQNRFTFWSDMYRAVT
ncbi:hypothetical protein PAXRUDRAFT_836585 [Paxillus rubicundulus Ve08.2h10]|uniref:Uncharacterized protein n=1 Tax=Paxillus rubicundulus Ve08.2h10 TaxID=930991 RepID=A0A0D0BJH5_9AGAM|nr:hypothetical protein PAXRUDRAFT_836585 [Paxillus rubicundulus Ve08.2h10]